MTDRPPPTPGFDDALGVALAEARDRLAELVDVTTWSLDDARLGTRIEDVLALKASVDELASRLVGEADDRHLAARHGASSTRAHLMAAYRMSAAEASRIVRTARQLHGSSVVAEPTRRAVALGKVSAEQGTVVASAVNRLSPTIDLVRVEAAQTDLLGHATRLSFTQLQTVANHLIEVVDPDMADLTLEEQLQVQERRAWTSASLAGQLGADGIARARFALPNLAYAMFKKHLDALASPRRNGNGDSGPGNHTGDGPRAATALSDADADDAAVAEVPYATRMGQAFCELIDHLPTEGHPLHGVVNASIVITIDETKLRVGAEPCAGWGRRGRPSRMDRAATPTDPASTLQTPRLLIRRG